MDRYIKVSEILDYLEVKIAKLQNEVCREEGEHLPIKYAYMRDMFRHKSKVLSEVIDYIKQQED